MAHDGDVTTAKENEESNGAARAAVLLTLSDKLDSQHVPEEQMEWWATQEASALENQKTPGEMHLRCRTLVLQLLMEVMRRSDTPVECWFQAARVLDANVANFDPSDPPARIFARGAAVWLLCYKAEYLDRARISPQRVDWLASLVSRMSTDLGSASVSQEAILAEERNLMRTESGAFLLPTVLKWSSMVSIRFSIVTTGVCNDVLGAVYPRWINLLAMSSIFSAPPSAANSPRLQAAGIFSLMLILANLVPAEEFLAAEADLKWLQALIADGPRPRSPLVPKIAKAALEFATGIKMCEIRRGTMAAFNLLHAQHKQ